MKIIAVTQARTGSSRLPAKIIKKIKGKTLLQIHLERILKSKVINKIIVATTKNKNDNRITDIAKMCGVKYFRGNENDVLDRFYKATKDYQADYIVRLTSDCPLIDPKLIDSVINVAIHNNYDYYANTFEELYPDGQDIEVFKFQALKSAWNLAKLDSEREHVTPFIRKNSSFKGGKLFTSANYYNNSNYGHVRMTVDDLNDFVVIEHLINNLGFDGTWLEYADFYLKNEFINKLNIKTIRNEGYIKSLKFDKK